MLHPSVSRPPPRGSVQSLLDENARLGLEVNQRTLRAGDCDALDLGLAVEALERVLAA